MVRKLVTWFALAALIAGIGLIGWSVKSGGRAQAPVAVSVAAAPAAHTAPRRVVAQAQIVPVEGIIEVRPLAEGRVLRVLAHPGDRVEADQLLAEIESTIQNAAVEAKEADVAAASERLRLVQEGVRKEDRAALLAAAEAARQEAEMARDRHARQQQLFEQGFVPAQTVEDAQRNAAAAHARAEEAQMRAQAGAAGGRAAEVRAARQQIAAASAARDVERVQLDRTRILAPVAGVVMTRNVNPGDVIAPSVSAPTLFKIVDPANIEVRLEVEELLAADVFTGQTVRFMLPGTQTEIGSGQLTRIAPQVEKRSIGADDARIRADSMIRPAWSAFVPLAGKLAPPINYRLEAWVEVGG